MNVLETLRQEEVKLECQLKAIKNAIAALSGSSGNSAASPKAIGNSNRTPAKRTLSAAGRARIAAAARARWAKIRAEKAKKGK